MQDSIHYRLRRCHMTCQKTTVQILKKTTDLRSGEPKIIEYLTEHAPCEQKDIAAGCELEPAAVTGILGRMEERGLITRSRRKGNRRSLFTELSEYGQKVSEEVENTFHIVDAKAVRGFTEEEKKQLTDLLDRVYTNLKEKQEDSK